MEIRRSLEQDYPIVIDTRTDPPTAHGQQGARVIIVGKEAFVVTAEIPLSDTIIIPAEYKGSIRIYTPQKEVGFIQKILQRIKG